MVKTGDGAWRGRLGGVEDLAKFAQSQLLPLPQYVELSHHSNTYESKEDRIPGSCEGHYPDEGQIHGQEGKQCTTATPASKFEYQAPYSFPNARPHR